MSYSFSCELVTEGHPEKIAEQISDAILEKDPHGRKIIVDTYGGTHLMVVKT